MINAIVLANLIESLEQPRSKNMNLMAVIGTPRKAESTEILVEQDHRRI